MARDADSYRAPVDILGPGRPISMYVPLKMIEHAETQAELRRKSGEPDFSRSHWFREAATAQMIKDIGEEAYRELCEYELVDEEKDDGTK